MKKDDIKLLQEVQKNAKMGMKALDVLSGKIYDDDFALQLSRQSMKYSELDHKAEERLMKGKAQTYQDHALEDMMLAGSIHTNTFFNTSTSHLADMVIQGSSRGLTGMWKAMNENTSAGRFSTELAEELVDFEEKNIEQLKKYL